MGDQQPGGVQVLGDPVPHRVPAEEKLQRKQLGILMMCASIMLPMFTKIIFNSMTTLQLTQPWIGKLWLTVLISAPATIAYVLLSYWKPLKTK